MHQPTRSYANNAVMLLLALAVAMAAAGCQTITPADMVPEPIVRAPAGYRFDGTVSVSVRIDARSLRYVRPRQMVSLDELATLTGLSIQALTEGIATVGDQGLVEIVAQYFGLFLRWQNAGWGWERPIYKDDVTFGARGMSPGLAAFAPQFAAEWANTYAPRIKESMEKSLTSSGLFPRTAPAKADYALDIWLDQYEPTMPPMGFGAWKADVLAIWRLTRASDGAILACDFAEGHGSFRKARSQPNHWAFAAAVQDMIGKILQALGDDPQNHLAALEPAGLGRIGGAGALPAAAAKWSERVTAGWPQLHTGMSLAEVAAVIGPLGAPREGWDCVFILPVYRKLPFAKDMPSSAGLTKLAFRVYRTDVFTLLFLVEDTHGSSAPLLAPGTLLVWQLRKK